MTISIVTPTFNAGSTIAEALLSADSPDDDTEHILVDAASKDNTLEVARHFKAIKIFSEPDKGIYDGMNKGAELARGEWLLFLQGDDWIPNGALTAYRRAIAENPGVEMICGDCEAVKESHNSWSPVWEVTDPSSKTLTVENIALGEPMINARIIRRDVFQRFGGFSLRYSLASDREFLLRCAEAGIRQAEIPFMTYRYRWHAGSSTMTEGNDLTDRLLDENLSIARRHLRNAKGGDRDALIRWNTILTLQGAMNALEKGGYRLGGFVVSGFSKDMFWPAVFFWEILKSIPGFLARGGRTRSQLRVDSINK